MVTPTGKQAFRVQEGILWKSCTAGTPFQVPTVFHNCMELAPQLVCDESGICLARHLRLHVHCAILCNPNLGRQAQPCWFEDKPDHGLLPRPCLSSGTCLRSIRATSVVTTHAMNWQFSKSLSQAVLGWTGITGVLPSRLFSAVQISNNKPTFPIFVLFALSFHCLAGCWYLAHLIA